MQANWSPLSSHSTRKRELDAVGAHPGRASECKGAGIPPQYYLGLLPGPGGICANDIVHGSKRDDMRSTARVSPRTVAVEYRLRGHPVGGNPTGGGGGKFHLLRR